MNASADLQCMPVPEYEYQVYMLSQGGPSNPDLADSAQLTALGREGWGVAGVVLDGAALVLARQVAVRLVPVKAPQIMGISGPQRLVADRGNGRG